MKIDHKTEMRCGHCDSVFPGTYKQRWTSQREKTPVYCSSACRYAASSKKAQERAIQEGKKPRTGILAGPCKKCGEKFYSRIDKQFCSMDCYTSSDKFKEMRLKNLEINHSEAIREKIAKSLRKGEELVCLECSGEFYRKKSKLGARNFCKTACYRAYMSKRFDRWVANPEGFSLPQCYDEFLDKESLRCIVDGCEWEGQHLTVHMNLAHGMPASDFKRATGFNLGTGVIAKPLAESFQTRELRGIAATSPGMFLDMAHQAKNGDYVRYRSLESREHRLKSRSLLGTGPTKICIGCQSNFIQSTPMGRALYCSTSCRSDAYKKKGKK